MYSNFSVWLLNTFKLIWFTGLFLQLSDLLFQFGLWLPRPVPQQLFGIFLCRQFWCSPYLLDTTSFFFVYLLPHFSGTHSTVASWEMMSGIKKSEILPVRKSLFYLHVFFSDSLIIVKLFFNSYCVPVVQSF